MKYKKGLRRPVKDYEKDLIKYWKTSKTFEKSISQRPQTNSYVFYDGPPFITGVPHHGNALSSIVKDAVPRYWTMKGMRVERVWGWDCHGLPAEVYTEKKLGIIDKRDIGTKVSLEEYIKTCRDNMVQTGTEWEEIIDRIGRWVDFKGAYSTMDNSYMESVWWAFKQLYDKGKIYEGEKVLLYCIRDATPISKAEVAMDNSYREVSDPSVYAKFKLSDSDSYLLAWTTTPWTLPANTALAVNKDVTYIEVDIGNEKLILAKDLVNKVLKDEKHQPIDYKVIKEISGNELIGRTYQPLINSDLKDNAFKIWQGDHVNLDDGTGIVHIAPAYGEDDYSLALENKFPIIRNIDDNGYFTDGEWQGSQVWESNKIIAKKLLSDGKVWKIDYYKHAYPHCHRCGTRLIYRAHPSWFFKVSDQKSQMINQNEDINWFPEHIKEGRFTKTIESAPDWNISRDRFWATAMPVWKGKDEKGNELVKVIGSYEELKDLSGQELEDYHRPWVDNITFELDGVLYKRIDKVLDCWFESGSMPFSQFHYPFENKLKFEQNFPGDFISEYVGQTRAWFYYMHAVSIGLFEKKAFKNVIVTGTLAGNDGRKMSKSFGNYTDPIELLDQTSADAYRMLLLSSPVLNGEDFTLLEKDVAQLNRKLSMIWNMYDFFSLYAEVDGWDSGYNKGDMPLDPSNNLTNHLDIWITSRLHELISHIDDYMQKYDIPNALKAIIPFIDDASNWFVRRSRKRFWKSSNDQDKDDAYRVLHYVLSYLALIMAPFTPFLSEELYRLLIEGESIHLLDWPTSGHINELVIAKMQFIRNIITEGLAIRAASSIKVRQPLNKLQIIGGPSFLVDVEPDYLDVLKDELNVKHVDLIDGPNKYKLILDIDLTDELKEEGLMRELVRQIQQLRKKADLEVNDRIQLKIDSSDQSINDLINNKTLTEILLRETLSISLNDDFKLNFEAPINLNGKQVNIGISKYRT